MFAFIDDSDETVKTRYAGVMINEHERVHAAANAVLSSAFVATAIFLVLLTFAAF